MMLDLRECTAKARAMVERFVTRYSAAAQVANGRKYHPPIGNFTLYFTLGDGESVPRFYLSADVRSTEPDGHATHPMFELVDAPELLPTVNWLLRSEQNKSSIVQMDGRVSLCSYDILAHSLRSALIDMLQHSRDDGLFAELPKQDGCQFFIEEWGGAFGWPEPEDRGRVNRA